MSSDNEMENDMDAAMMEAMGFGSFGSSKRVKKDEQDDEGQAGDASKTAQKRKKVSLGGGDGAGSSAGNGQSDLQANPRKKLHYEAGEANSNMGQGFSQDDLIGQPARKPENTSEAAFNPLAESFKPSDKQHLDPSSEMANNDQDTDSGTPLASAPESAGLPPKPEVGAVNTGNGASHNRLPNRPSHSHNKSWRAEREPRGPPTNFANQNFQGRGPGDQGANAHGPGGHAAGGAQGFNGQSSGGQSSGGWTAPTGVHYTNQQLYQMRNGIKTADGATAYFKPSFIEDPWKDMEPVKIKPTQRYE